MESAMSLQLETSVFVCTHGGWVEGVGGMCAGKGVMGSSRVIETEKVVSCCAAGGHQQRCL